MSTPQFVFVCAKPDRSKFPLVVPTPGPQPEKRCEHPRDDQRHYEYCDRVCQPWSVERTRVGPDKNHGKDNRKYEGCQREINVLLDCLFSQRCYHLQLHRVRSQCKRLETRRSDVVIVVEMALCVCFRLPFHARRLQLPSGLRGRQRRALWTPRRVAHPPRGVSCRASVAGRSECTARA